MAQGDMMLNTMQMGNFPAMGELLNIPLDKLTTFDVNDCGYSGSGNYRMLNWAHPFF